MFINMRKIASDLTRRGIKSSRGNAISINVLSIMLKNRRYLGEYRFRDIFKEDAIPAIISHTN